MNKKIYNCKQCGDYLSGSRRKFCSRKCNATWQSEQNIMDFGTGHGHSHHSRFGEDASIESLYVPYNVLQEAKNISDLTNERNIVEDPETVSIAMKCLSRNTPTHIYNAKQLNHMRWKKKQIKLKNFHTIPIYLHRNERQKK